MPTLGFHFPGHHVIDLGFWKVVIEPLSKESYTFYGIWALTIVYTAYVTEVYRAGIEPSTRASGWRRARSGSATCSRCATSSCRRRCAG